MTGSIRTLVCCLGILVTGMPQAWSGCIVPAGASGSNPNSRYVISLTNQEVYDTVTNITWQRCPLNWFASPDGRTCLKMMGNGDLWTQRPHGLTTFDGVWQYHSGPSEWVQRGWTIPSRGDLGTLIDHICKNPAINQEVFPNTPANNFWTSSSKGTNSHGHEFLYVVNFAGDGGTDDHEDANLFNVRLMYKGQSPAIQVTLERQPVATQ